MSTGLSPELYWLSATALLTALMWVPYTLQLIGKMGTVSAFWDPYHETPITSRWGQRAKRAHVNAVENLTIFAPLALAVHGAGLGNATTAAACAAYFTARAAHYAVYVLAVPLARSLLFLVGVGCQIILAARLLGA